MLKEELLMIRLSDANSINYVRPGDLAWNSEHIGIIISVDKNKCDTMAEARGASYG